MTLPVAILAGGLATRLGDTARATPKCLLDIAGEPFAVHQIRLLASHGFTDLVFLVGHLADQVEGALGDGRRWGVRVRYVHDGPARLGTGGALRHAVSVLGDRWLVLYGDSYLECDYRAVQDAFGASGRLGLMTVFRNDGQWDRSNVRFEAGQILDYDKARPSPEMRHIDYGLGALSAAALRRYDDGRPLDLAEVYRDLLAERQLAGYEVHERFYEIGSPAGLAETRARIQRRTAAPGTSP